MAHAAMVDAFIGQELGAVFGDELGFAEPGYIVPGPCDAFVQVAGRTGPELRVVATAQVLEGVAPTTELYEALNDLNAGALYGRFYLTGDEVWVQHTVFGDTIGWPELENAFRFVQWAAGTAGPELADRLGLAPTTATAATGAELPGLDTNADAVTAGATGLDLGGERLEKPLGANAAGYL